MKRKIFQLIFLLLPAMGIGGSLHAQTYWTDALYKGTLKITGTQGSSATDPINIGSEGELADLAFQVRGGNAYAGKYFKLTRDLHLKGHYWESIGMDITTEGYSREFQGYFDGGGFTIYDMQILPASTSGESKGLFGYISGNASIKNVFLEGVVVEGNSTTGGLVGLAVNSSISDCSVLGTIRDVQNIAGGIVAQADGCEITNCYSNVKFEDVTNIAGGLVGQLISGSTLSSSYSAGRVVGQSSVGGLVGSLEGGSIVTNCYSMAVVIAYQQSGRLGSPMGGLVGAMTQDSEISNCFARNPWIQGVTAANSININRVVGIPTSSTGYSGLKNNVALNMLVSRDGRLPVDTIQAAEVGADTPNGKTILDICEWDGGESWVVDTCTTPPYLQEQSAPVTIVTSTTNEIIVKYPTSLGDDSKKVFGTEHKIALLNSVGDTLAINDAVGAKITSVASGLDSTWRFTPIAPFAFQLDSVFSAVAYEYGKMPSYPVQIIITPWDGNGKDKPYLIYTEPQLDAVRKFPDANYKLMNDLNMSDYSIDPIEKYTGTFDGNHHIIDSLTINNPTKDNQGLFGDLEGTVKNLGLENVYITGNDNVGALAGYGNSTKAIIQNVYTTGTIIAQGNNVGGLAGQLAAKVLSCYSTCLVKGKNNVGGLIGTASGIVQYCYAAGPVFGTDNTGGFVGESQSDITASYSCGLVSSSGQYFGGFIGIARKSVASCAYSPNSSGQDSPVGLALGTNNCQTLDLKTCASIFSNSIGWFNTDNNYPQLSVFANDTAQNISYCSALSVVPIPMAFKSGDRADAVTKSFNAPAGNGILINKIIPSGGSATCSIDSISVASVKKVISTLPTGSADTLKITVKPFILQQQSSPAVNIYERSRRMCFIPDQIPLTLTATRTEGIPNENGWSKDSVVFTLSKGVDADSLIGGPVKFQHLISTDVDWDTLPGDTDIFNQEIKGLKVQYRAFNDAVTGDPISPKYNGIISDTVNIDKTPPVISKIDMSAAGTSTTPVPGQATVSITFKDTLSGIAAIQWEIGSPRLAGHSIGADSIDHTTTDFKILAVALPKIAGSYPVSFTITDNAGNTISSKDTEDSLTVYVQVPNGYVLDSVTVDGDKAIEDPTDSLVWTSAHCVTEDSAKVILTPAPSFGIAPIVVTVKDLQIGDNSREFTVVSKDGTVVQTFTIKICYENIPDIVIIDDINYKDGNLEQDPDAANPSPWIDKDGNIVYDLVSKCVDENGNPITDHYLKITPVPATAIVTFDGVPKEDNIYRFDIANYYVVKVKVVDGETTRNYIFNVLKKFSRDIFYSRWATNDVVSVINNPSNNGGYTFTKYGWYQNSVANAETRSYLEVRPGDTVEAILSGEYNGEDGENIKIEGVPTCPCVIGASIQADIQVYPSILKASEKVTISTENIPEENLKEGNVSIIGSMGNRISKKSLTGSSTEVTMPDAPGIYLLRVSTATVTKEFKVILK